VRCGAATLRPEAVDLQLEGAVPELQEAANHGGLVGLCLGPPTAAAWGIWYKSDFPIFKMACVGALMCSAVQCSAARSPQSELCSWSCKNTICANTVDLPEITVQCGALRCGAVHRCGAVQLGAVQCSVVQAGQCSVQ
jgi:hypothetical protein